MVASSIRFSTKTLLAISARRDSSTMDFCSFQGYRGLSPSISKIGKGGVLQSLNQVFLSFTPYRAQWAILAKGTGTDIGNTFIEQNRAVYRFNNI
jgi:hypothetical protein